MDLSVYVDDIISVSNAVKMRKAEKESFFREFEIFDLGEIQRTLQAHVSTHRRDVIYLEAVR